MVEVITYEYFGEVTVFVDRACLLNLNSVTIESYLLKDLLKEPLMAIFLKLKYISIN